MPNPVYVNKYNRLGIKKNPKINDAKKKTPPFPADVKIQATPTQHAARNSNANVLIESTADMYKSTSQIAKSNPMYAICLAFSNMCTCLLPYTHT